MKYVVSLIIASAATTTMTAAGPNAPLQPLEARPRQAPAEPLPTPPAVATAVPVEPARLAERAHELAPPTPFHDSLLEGAFESVDRAPRYDSSYVVLSYPGGDPGWDRGCSVDVVIRAFRFAGIDLQQGVISDMIRERETYEVGEREPDASIDHRRIRNLERYFGRYGEELSTSAGADWRPGDVVFWSRDEKDRSNHVGVISNRLAKSGLPFVIHHPVGGVPAAEDVLLKWRVRGHYRWPQPPTVVASDPG